VCKSNERQINLAIRLYVEQFGVYPTAESWWLQVEPNSGTKWPDNLSILPLRRTGRPNNIFACPAYNQFDGIFQRGRAPGDTLGSYGYNCWGLSINSEDTLPWFGGKLGLGGRFTSPDPSRDLVEEPIKERQILKPADMIEIGDAFLGLMIGSGTDKDFKAFLGNCILDQGMAGPSYFNTLVLGLPDNGWEPPAQIRQRHGGRWNVAFCDGHVENLRSASFFDFRRDNVLARWNNDNQPHRELLRLH
jgi:prepilin-type processing-associated H-X9-DG protein